MNTQDVSQICSYVHSYPQQLQSFSKARKYLKTFFSIVIQKTISQELKLIIDNLDTLMMSKFIPVNRCHTSSYTFVSGCIEYPKTRKKKLILDIR